MHNRLAYPLQYSIAYRNILSLFFSPSTCLLLCVHSGGGRDVLHQWRSQYVANRATAPRTAKGHFCKSCKSDEILEGRGEGVGWLSLCLLPNSTTRTRPDRTRPDKVRERCRRPARTQRTSSETRVYDEVWSGPSNGIWLLSSTSTGLSMCGRLSL